MGGYDVNTNIEKQVSSNKKFTIGSGVYLFFSKIDVFFFTLKKVL